VSQNPPPSPPESLFLIAGSGSYPALVIREARTAGVKKIHLAAFLGETDPALAGQVDSIEWLRVGQLGALLRAAEKSGAAHAIMAGQLAPKNLFDLRPDWKALLVLAKLPQRNAESLFGAVARELESSGLTLLLATTFLDHHLAPAGQIAGPRLKPRQLTDLAYGFAIAKEISRLDIGQTVVVKNGTVLAVEGFEGTNECLRRGGELGRGAATMVKVSKPGQDLRFDVPVVGTLTLETAAAAGIRHIGVEAGQTLLLDRPIVLARADELKVTLYGLSEDRLTTAAPACP
jgi:UDP-2,3-diacylglucosamine hydrolase